MKYRRHYLEHYNLALSDLNNIVDNWDESCAEHLSVPKETRQYNLNTKIKFSDDSKNSQIENLKTINDYQTSLNDVKKMLSQGQTPKMNEIIKLHLYHQTVNKYERNVSVEEVKQVTDALNSIVNSINPKVLKQNLGEMKVHYETLIENKIGKKLKYNKAYTSVPSKILNGISQCYGGTLTDLLINVISKGTDYYNQRPVVILSNGHILPGFIVGFEKDWYLYGVETTVKGKGLTYYGELNQMTNLRNKIIAYDAYDFLVASSVQNYIEDYSEVLRNLFYKFASEYEIQKS